MAPYILCTPYENNICNTNHFSSAKWPPTTFSSFFCHYIKHCFIYQGWYEIIAYNLLWLLTFIVVLEYNFYSIHKKLIRSFMHVVNWSYSKSCNYLVLIVQRQYHLLMLMSTIGYHTLIYLNRYEAFGMKVTNTYKHNY